MVAFCNSLAKLVERCIFKFHSRKIHWASLLKKAASRGISVNNLYFSVTNFLDFVNFYVRHRHVERTGQLYNDNNKLTTEDGIFC